jgi:hypothetical protein
MSHPTSPPSPTECLFTTLVHVMLPFYLTGAGGDAATVHALMLELIEAYHATTAAERDLVGRLASFSAAAMDNPRLSMRSDLSDRKILQYRANAVALNRSAEQCRKTLDAMQTKREQTNELAAMTHPRPPPTSRPASSLREMPPAQPHASSQTAFAYPGSTVEGDPEFACDLQTMKRNTRAMLADLQAIAKDLDPETPETSAAQPGLARNRPIPPGHAEPARYRLPDRSDPMQASDF